MAQTRQGAGHRAPRQSRDRVDHGEHDRAQRDAGDHEREAFGGQVRDARHRNTDPSRKKNTCGAHADCKASSCPACPSASPARTDT